MTGTMPASAVDPSYEYNDLMLVEERQKLILVLERLDEESVVLERPPPNPLEQYQFLTRLLHVVPCEPYVEVLQAHFSSAQKAEAKTELNFERTYLGHTHWIAVFLTLPACRYLQKINFTQQRLTSVLVNFMCDAVVQLPAIYSVDVSFNPFGSTGVKYLIRLARKKPNIVFCGFSGIHCTTKLGRQLEETITENRRPFLEEARKVAEKRKALQERYELESAETSARRNVEKEEDDERSSAVKDNARERLELRLAAIPLREDSEEDAPRVP